LPKEDGWLSGRIAAELLCTNRSRMLFTNGGHITELTATVIRNPIIRNRIMKRGITRIATLSRISQIGTRTHGPIRPILMTNMDTDTGAITIAPEYEFC
jgi:hypothetical protein